MTFENHDDYKVTELELVYRNNVRPEERLQISSSAAAYNILKNSWDQNRIELIEEFKIILLDVKMNCLGISAISVGTMTQCPIDMKIVFSTVLLGKACKFIAAHNHPSGFPYPSKDDCDLTTRLVEAGRLLSVEVEDHVIVTKYDYYSFADNGLIPK